MKPTRHTHTARGASLLELILYIGIFSVVSAMFVGIVFYASLGWTRANVESEVKQNLRFAMEDISRSVRQASSVASPAAGASANALSLAVGGQTVAYSLSGTTLQKQIGAGPAEALTTSDVKVTYLSFTTIQNTAASNAAVQATSTRFAMSVGYNSDSPQFDYTQHATSTATLQNK